MHESTTLFLPPPQPVINAPRGDINFVCPGSGYIGGLFSTYNFSASDRIWQPYCCVRSYSSLVNCAGPPATWSNLLGMNLNYSAGDPYVITGLYSFYSNLDLLVFFCLIAKLECLFLPSGTDGGGSGYVRFKVCVQNPQLDRLVANIYSERSK